MTTTAPEVVSASWARRSWAAAHLLGAFALGGALSTWAGVLVVIGSTVVPLWATALVALLAWTVARLALMGLQVPRPSPAPRWRWLVSVTTAGAWVLVPLTAVAHGIGGPSYAVVEPPGSGGCRAVVAESSFFKSGSGTVYVAGGWGPFALRVGSFGTDEGFRPVSAGSYSVSWYGRSGGSLQVDGTLLGDDGTGDSDSFRFDC